MKRFLFLIGCLFSTIATASSWHFIGVGGDYSAIYYDRDSVEQTGNKVRAWVATIPPYKAQASYNLLMVLWEIDKTNLALRQLQLDAYLGREHVNSITIPSEWRYITPGTVATMMFEYVTTRRKSEYPPITGSFDELIVDGQIHAKAEIWLQEMSKSEFSKAK